MVTVTATVRFATCARRLMWQYYIELLLGYQLLLGY